MLDKLETVHQQVEAYLLNDKKAIENFKREITGKNGIINELFEAFKGLSGTEKAKIGKPLNELKAYANEKLNSAIEQQLSTQPESSLPYDISLPGKSYFGGGRHPIFAVQNKIIETFKHIGYIVTDGPEIETDWYNFTALNFEPNHPARDMQDTFFVHKEPDFLLRTHTSNLQIRELEKGRLPIYAIAPGRVYRNETVSVRAHCYFNQIEVFAVDTGIHFGTLKQTLHYFATQMFGENVDIRLRPSYFPFTEMSAEMDVSCLICEGKGCTVCKNTGWVEVLGSGMIDPNVLKNVNIDAEKYTGFALGMGVERIAQLLFRVPDLRLYSQNDIRFLKQFQSFA